MNKKIYIPAKGPEDWKQFLAKPDLHWKFGHSAMSMAYCWQNADGIPASVQKVFVGSKIPLLKKTKVILAIPEYKVPLPGRGPASQNDLFVLAKSDDQLIVIMVEGKASEPFGDKTVREWINNASEGKKKRLKALCGEIGLEQSRVMGIRYQLIHRTAAAVLEAKKFNSSSALMLIHSFPQGGDKTR